MIALVAHAWRTPLGRSVDDVLARWRAGERAACAHPRAAGYACTIVAPITEEPARSRQARFLRRMGLFGLEVAQEAWARGDLASVDRARVGLFAGVGGLRAHWDDMLKALADQDETGAHAWERGLREVHPYWMLRHLSNNVHALAAMELGLRGEGATFGGATGGAQAIAAAARALAEGAIDAALVVAYDSLLEPETLVELGARRAATREPDPARIAPAYDPRAAGFVPGEAAGALVLVRAEEAPHAPRVSIRDGADGSAHEPSARALARAIDASTIAGRIALVDGAARGWPDLDAEEGALLAVRVPAGTPVIALASALGQLGAATAVVQAIALAALLREDLAALPGLRLGTGASPPGRVALGLSTGAPGLYAALRVELS